jgi:hypothetical protein
MNTTHDDVGNSKAVDPFANIRNKISRFAAELEDIMDADITPENEQRCKFLTERIQQFNVGFFLNYIPLIPLNDIFL